MQRTVICILMAFTFAALGSGALPYVHNLAHEAEDARLLHDGHHPVDHDETNCDLHRQLHLPMLGAGWVPLLICLGLFIAFLTMLQPALLSLRLVSRLVCRGPPAV